MSDPPIKSRKTCIPSFFPRKEEGRPAQVEQRLDNVEDTIQRMDDHYDHTFVSKSQLDTFMQELKSEMESLKNTISDQNKLIELQKQEIKHLQEVVQKIHDRQEVNEKKISQEKLERRDSKTSMILFEPKRQKRLLKPKSEGALSISNKGNYQKTNKQRKSKFCTKHGHNHTHNTDECRQLNRKPKPQQTGMMEEENLQKNHLKPEKTKEGFSRGHDSFLNAQNNSREFSKNIPEKFREDSKNFKTRNFRRKFLSPKATKKKNTPPKGRKKFQPGNNIRGLDGVIRQLSELPNLIKQALKNQQQN